MESRETDSMTPLPTPINKVFIEKRISSFLWLYGQSFNLVLGLTGNILSLMVLSRAKMRQATSNIYLIIVSTTDTLMLLVGLGTRHLYRSITAFDPTSSSHAYCITWYFVLKVSESYNRWTLAGMSLERCIAVAFPLKSKAFITKRNAKLYLSIAFFCVVTYNVHWFKSFALIERMGRKVCTANPENYFSLNIRVWSDYVFLQILPGVFIFFCNGFLIRTLIQRKEAGVVQTSTGGKDPLHSIVKMLVAVCIGYLILTTPGNIAYIMNSAFHVVYANGSREIAINELMWASVAFCQYFNNAINFILYITTGSQFRAEFKAMIFGNMQKRSIESTKSRITEESNTGV